jgi:hypothetical protein
MIYFLILLFTLSFTQDYSLQNQFYFDVFTLAFDCGVYFTVDDCVHDGMCNWNYTVGSCEIDDCIMYYFDSRWNCANSGLHGRNCTMTNVFFFFINIFF